MSSVGHVEVVGRAGDPQQATEQCSRLVGVRTERLVLAVADTAFDDAGDHGGNPTGSARQSDAALRVHQREHLGDARDRRRWHRLARQSFREDVVDGADAPGPYDHRCRIAASAKSSAGRRGALDIEIATREFEDQRAIVAVAHVVDRAGHATGGPADHLQRGIDAASEGVDVHRRDLHGWRLTGSRFSLSPMSERSRNLPRRSCLSVPGSSEKMMAKAPGLGADMVFLDLEDAVAPLEKPAARDKIVKAINELDWGETVLCVRVNAWDTEWTYRDVIAIVEGAGERLDELMLPKVQSAAEVQALDMLLTQIEKTTGRESRVGIEAQIETAQGLINVEEICAASDRLETIIFGPADFAASTEMPVADRRRADPRVPRRPLPLRLLEDPHGRARQRPAGHRRPVPQDPRARRASATTRCAAASSASTASGRCTPTR